MADREARRKKDNRRLRARNLELARRLAEAEQALEAIRTGQVESLVVDGPNGPRIFSLEGAAHSYRVLVEAIGEGAATIAEDGIILYCNAAFARLIDAPLHQVMGRPVQLHVTETFRPTLEATLRRAAGGEEPRGELSLVDRAGQEVPVYLSASALVDDGRRVICMVATDLRGQKRHERILASERLSRTIFEQVADAILVCDDDGRVIRASRAAHHLLGTNPLGLVFDEAFAFEPTGPDSHAGRRMAAAALGGDRLHAAPMRFSQPDGTRLDVLASAALLRGAEGERGGCVITLVDVSEVRRAAELLASEREQFRTTLTSIGDAVLVTDAAGRVTLLNDAARRLTGSGDEAIGQHLDAVLHVINPDNPDAPEGLARQALVRRDGTEVAIDHTGAPIRDANGTVQGEVLVFRDVTERRRVQAELERTARELAEVVKRKDDFLAILSHELRNPLAPIRNSLTILQRCEPDSEPAVRARAVLDRQVAHMTRLVDDLLDVTRIARGKIRLKREPIEIGAVVRQTVEDYRANFESAGVLLELIPAASPLYIDADPTRVAQVVGNLLHNAAKFTRRGGRTSIAVGEDRARGEAVVRVMDTGAGMAGNVLPRLFQPFSQAAATLTENRGGLGLGLALVKGIVELHGGSVAASSEGVGRGSEFVVRLPLSASVATADGDREERTATPPLRRVLVVDDNVDAAETLRDVLELAGHSVEVAYCGREAIERTRRWRPDIVLCDIGLPDIDGYEVGEAIRADRTLASTVLVALSGYAQPEDVARSKRAGFNSHLAKPPDIGKLEEVLRSPPALNRGSGHFADTTSSPL